MRRPRGPGGRFLTGDEIRALELQQAAHPSQRPDSSNGQNGNHAEGEQGSGTGATEGKA